MSILALTADEKAGSRVYVGGAKVPGAMKNWAPSGMILANREFEAAERHARFFRDDRPVAMNART